MAMLFFEVTRDVLRCRERNEEVPEHAGQITYPPQWLINRFKQGQNRMRLPWQLAEPACVVTKQANTVGAEKTHTFLAGPTSYGSPGVLGRAGDHVCTFQLI